MAETHKTNIQRTLARRSLDTGLLWTAPVIALAPAAQAYSTSAPQITVIGGATKLPGHSCCSSASWPGPGSCPYYDQSYRYYFTAVTPPTGPCAGLVNGTRHLVHAQLHAQQQLPAAHLFNLRGGAQLASLRPRTADPPFCGLTGWRITRAGAADWVGECRSRPG